MIAYNDQSKILNFSITTIIAFLKKGFDIK